MPAIRTLPPQPATRNSVASTIPQKPSSGRPDRRREVEHVPREPEDERADEDDHEENRDRDRQPARDERADSEHAQDHAGTTAPTRVPAVYAADSEPLSRATTTGVVRVLRVDDDFAGRDLRGHDAEVGQILADE